MNTKRFYCMMLIVLVLVTCILGGCSKAVNTTTGKSVTIALSGGPTSLDPATTVDGFALMVELNLYNTLVETKGGNSAEIHPELATDWTISEDNLVYTFKLRDDVTFHNGQKMTSADVKYTFERVMIEPYTSYYAEMIDSVKAPDDYTFVVTLKYPHADFLTQLGGIYYGIVSEKAILDAGDNFMYKPVGTGPYKLSGTYVPDQTFSFVVNENYWGDKPDITNVNYRIIPQSSTSVVALQNGEVDFVMSISSNDYDMVKNDPKLAAYQAPSFTNCHLAFNKLGVPFSEYKVRNAIAKAIDKENIVSAAFDGAGSVANSPLNSLMMGYTDEIPGNEFDLNAAKAALSEAGYADGFTTTILCRSDRDYAIKTAQVLQAQLAEIGITVKVEQLEKATYNERLMSANFDMAVSTLNWPDSNNMLAFLYDSNGTFNYDKAYSNAEIDKLLIEARTINDTEKRTEIYTKIVKLAYQEMPIVPLFFPNEIVGANAKIKGIEIVDNMYYPIYKWTLSD